MNEHKTQRMVVVGTTFGRWILTLVGVLTASGVAASITVVTNYGQRITRVETQIEDVRHTLDRVDKSMEKIEQKIGAVESRQAAQESRQERLEKKIDEILLRMPK